MYVLETMRFQTLHEGVHGLDSSGEGPTRMRLKAGGAHENEFEAETRKDERENP